jgi:hypothetical protein
MDIAAGLLRHLESNFPDQQPISRHPCAFYLGNTAPDVQVVSGDARESTHFFVLPFQPDAPPAWEVFLEMYPELANSNKLPPEQAAFLAGYLCHLQADWYWVKEIFAPIFGPTSPWGTFRERLYLHNVLRAYLDQQVMQALDPAAKACLDQVAPKDWLPFVAAHNLDEWRDTLSRQLQPGALAETVEVFADRQGISPAEFYELLGSPTRMDQEVFALISRQKLAKFRKKLIIENLHLLKSYLGL